ncbi:MAG: hypothetical protein MJ223_04365 [Mycoplasmoidaceae bacterium]|nr:hypothetical protein [Mycoplasmoidaceae bacterium]
MLIKNVFQRELSKNLNLLRVSAPLFVTPDSGFQDDLNGVERKVVFDIKKEQSKTGNCSIFSKMEKICS